MINFLPIYYSSIIISVLPAVFILSGERPHRRVSNYIISLVALFLFCFVSFRESGADLNTYKMEYVSGGISILDVGYIFIIKVFNSIGVPFSAFLLFCNLFVFYSIFVISRKLQVSYGFVFLVYLLHLFLVRDLAHLRTSLAVAFIFIGFGKRIYISVIFYFIAVSIHTTMLPLIGAILLSGVAQNWIIHKFKILIILLLPFGVLLQGVVSSVIDIVGMISARARVYGKLFQQSNEYEIKITLVYFVVVTIISWLMLPKKESGSLVARTLCVNILGLYFYAVFGGVPEIGPRVFNVLMSFYPIQLAYILDLYYKSSAGVEIKTGSSVLGHRAVRMLFVIILLIPLVIRQDSFKLLEKVSF